VKQLAPHSKDIGNIIERDLADILFVGFFHAEQKNRRLDILESPFCWLFWQYASGYCIVALSRQFINMGSFDINHYSGNTEIMSQA
jgi:hypothetical protein